MAVEQDVKKLEIQNKQLRNQIATLDRKLKHAIDAIRNLEIVVQHLQQKQ